MKIKLIIGLGNPGKEYENTYHNAGFLALDYLIKNPPDCRLLKSTAYMNQSGSFVAKEIKKRRLQPEEVLVVHDDSDIELGKHKIVFGRGAAGHQGVQSVINALKTKNFRRLRIGIRKREKTRQKAGDFVLEKINPKDAAVLKTTLAAAVNEVFKKS